MLIESVHNPRVRAWAGLKSKRGRVREQAFLVEGVRLTQEALQSSLDVLALLVCADAEWAGLSKAAQAQLADWAAARKVPVYTLSPAAFAAVADTVTPQEVMAVVALPPAHPGEPAPWTVLLDGLQDPGNAGTLLRSAEAFGVTEVCFGSGCVDPFAPKVVRAAMGGLFRLRVHNAESLGFVQRWRRAWPEGRVVVAAATGGCSCDELDWRRPTLLCIGSEAHGVSAAVQAAADVSVRIPMAGRAESLNAAMAGTVLMYEAMRQRRL
ncbi:MAG: RNA methyltransferase [Alicyclobacillus sp.]|nr:RNA methyltransferase [Alicyclobacillus sp.]